MMSIRTNVSALFAHRNMLGHQKIMNKSLLRLSSGYRINSAADDAAGLAISERMRGQIRGLKMASQNAQNAISLLQTAEGGLNETHAILQRMRELAVQAANGTYSDEDREKIQLEYLALMEEIDRISNATNYNGINLLNGSTGGVKGEDGLSQLGLSATDFTAAGLSGTGKITMRQLDNGTMLLSLQMGNETVIGRLDSSGDVTFTLEDGSTLKLQGLNASMLKEGTVSNIRFDGTSTSPDFKESLTANHGGNITFQIGANGTKDQQLGLHIRDMSTGSLGNGIKGLRETDLLTRDNSAEALSVLDGAVKQVSTERARIGATINRLQHTVNSLETAAENLTAAESRIRDADMAAEMMNFTKHSILMQTAQAMLAQAMNQPNYILELLNSM